VSGRAGRPLTRFLAALLLVWAAAGHAQPAPESTEALLEQAGAQFEARDYVAARAVARRVLARDADHPRALWLLGWSEYQLGNYEQARLAFERLAEAQGRSVASDVGLGWSLFKLGRLARARRHFEAARGSAVGDQRYIVADGLGWIAYVRGDYERAAELFRAHPQARERGGAPEDGALGLGWIALTLGRLDATVGHFREGLERQPRYFRLHAGLGLVALFRGRNREALDHTLEGFEHTPYNRELVLLLDAVLRKLADPERSAQVYRELHARYPEIPVFLNGLGWAELDLGRLVAAQGRFIAALERLPDYPLARLGLERSRALMNAEVAAAWDHYAKGDFRNALAEFERPRGDAPRRNPAIHTGRGWSLLMLGEPEAARRAFEDALEVDPHFALAREGLAATRHAPETVYLKGWELLESGRFERARTQFERARKLMERAAHWRIDEALAWVRLLEGDTEAAARTFEQLLATRPDAHLSAKGLGYAAIERGDHTRALQWLERSFTLEPEQIPTSFTVPARRLIDAGEPARAVRVLEAGTRAHPDHADIHYLLARARAATGEPAHAARHAQRAAELAPGAIHPVFDRLGLDPRRVRDAYLALAQGLFADGDNEGARRRFSDYLAAGGSDPTAVRGRGFALYRLGRFRDAIPDLRRASTHEPDPLGPVTDVVRIPGTGESWTITFNARSTLAWAHLLLGEAERAADTFRTVLEDHPGWIDTLTGLGYALLSLGEERVAARRFREALLISPGYPDAWQGLRRAGAAP